MAREGRLDQHASGARAWTAATIDARSAWYYRLPAAATAPVEQGLQDLKRAGRPITEMALSDADREALVEPFAPVLEALDEGRGFAIVEGLPLEQVAPDEAQAIYWLVGLGLGEPFAQNVQGTLLYDVRDTGQSVSTGARFSVTNAESTFHTDNSFGDEVLDYVGLLCLRTARSGGVNEVVSAYALHNVLLEEHPEVLETLYQPFHVDRRGGVRPGEAPTVLRPIIEWDGEELVVRYLRYWIEAGHEKAGQPLTERQRQALDTLDQVLRRRDLQVEFALRPGDMFFINNRWIFHNRTAFDDHPEPELRRHYVRLWLKRKIRAYA